MGSSGGIKGGDASATQHGVLGESMDAAAANSQITVPTAGVIHVARIYVPVGGTISNIVFHVSTAGATLTAGQNFAALLDDAGNRLSLTADQSTAWTSVGQKAMALATPQVIPGGTYVRAAFVFNGTTGPTIRAGSTSFITANLGLNGGANTRFGTMLTGQTTIPATMAFSNLVIDGAFAINLT